MTKATLLSLGREEFDDIRQAVVWVPRMCGRTIARWSPWAVKRSGTNRLLKAASEILARAGYVLMSPSASWPVSQQA